MHRTLPWLLALAIAATPVLAAVPAATAAGPASALTIRFLALDTATLSAAGGGAFVDFGSLAVGPGHGRSRERGIVVRRRVAVQLDAPPGTPPSARLSVALTAETPGCTVRVDGMTLSTVPRVIAPVHRIGTAVVHEIEVTIPASVPAGTFLSDLQWFAEND